MSNAHFLKALAYSLLVLGIIGCAPRQQAFQHNTLSAPEIRTLISPFLADLQTRGITPVSASGDTIQPASEDALVNLVTGFAGAHPGYCPLTDSPFVSDASGLNFMAIYARGNEVQILIYSRAEAARLKTATVVGRSMVPLSTRPCQSPVP